MATPQNVQNGKAWVRDDKGNLNTKTEVKVVAMLDPGAEVKKRGTKGHSKKGIRVKFVDPTNASFVVQRRRLPDDTFMVRTIHKKEVGKKAQIGQVTTHKTEEEATKRFEEIVEEAKKKGWTSHHDTKAFKSDYDVTPEPSKVASRSTS